MVGGVLAELVLARWPGGQVARWPGGHTLSPAIQVERRVGREGGLRALMALPARRRKSASIPT